ncbi:MAG: 50S ribosomal protein L18 [Thermoplasmata archaeon M11B2D]|nr:MAG: 50S ribosomal protein L18 [Thermoplasmata archaeon M11B2D]PNX53463.1 MAG: 50S ribosomal protein L18 [Thermoplasmata archaeon M9B2D]
MKTGPRYHVKPRRHRERKTDYHLRLKLLRSKKPRIVVRKSLRAIRVQFVEYSAQGDKVLASALSNELAKEYGWKYSVSNTPAAYLTGFLAGKRAKQKGIEQGVLDIGLYRPTVGSTLFASLKGVLDAGITCPHDVRMLPKEERIYGVHLHKDIKPLVSDIKSKMNAGKEE